MRNQPTIADQDLQRQRNLAALPHYCFATVMGTKPTQIVFIQAGIEGYTPATVTQGEADLYNTTYDITPEQIKAMLTGSMFGFHVPGANPAHYRNHNGTHN